VFDTLFTKNWLDIYRHELKELLGEPEGELGESNLWILLCALDDIDNGRISDLSYKYDDGEEVIECSQKTAPYGN
jgi:hypothetical protein